MTKKTGGPAFPTDNAHQNGPSTFHFEGMTLRDYFAAKAMQGLIDKYGFSATDERLAADSYEMADAMLKAREQ
jgi:hypothetical protein